MSALPTTDTRDTTHIHNFYQLCVQSRDQYTYMHMHMHSKKFTKDTNLIIWNQTVLALKPEIVGDVPATISWDTCAR